MKLELTTEYIDSNNYDTVIKKGQWSVPYVSNYL